MYTQTLRILLNEVITNFLDVVFEVASKDFCLYLLLKKSNANGFPFDVKYFLASSIWDSSYWDQAGSQGSFHLV